MLDKTTRKELVAMVKNITVARAELDKYEARYDELRLKALRTVTTTKVGETITLESGNRIIKAKKNRFGRYKVTEGKKTLDAEYFGGIHDLRFAVAMGQI